LKGEGIEGGANPGNGLSFAKVCARSGFCFPVIGARLYGFGSESLSDEGMALSRSRVADPDPGNALDVI